MDRGGGRLSIPFPGTAKNRIERKIQHEVLITVSETMIGLIDTYACFSVLSEYSGKVFNVRFLFKFLNFFFLSCTKSV